jgi:hypothetical protein
MVAIGFCGHVVGCCCCRQGAGELTGKGCSSNRLIGQRNRKTSVHGPLNNKQKGEGYQKGAETRDLSKKWWKRLEIN